MVKKPPKSPGRPRKSRRRLKFATVNTGKSASLVAAPPDSPASDTTPRVIMINPKAKGSSGSLIFSGFYDEEYLHELRGIQGAKVYDKMRRQDARVKMVVSAAKNPLKSALWDIQAGGEDDSQPYYATDAALVKHILFEDMRRTWKELIVEITTMIEFGLSCFEIQHKLVHNHPVFGSYIGLQQLGFRNPKTIFKWNLDRETGDLLSITQLAFGDLQRQLEIPGEFLIVFTLDQEGDNYEGISPLRACYGPWFRKQQYLKLMAIGVEKSAIPTPVATVPAGQQGSDSYNELINVLESYVSNESGYITLPSGWAIDFLKNPFNVNELKEAVQFENTEMSLAFLENFLELGHSGSSGGSYALGQSLSDFFLNSEVFIADLICDRINRKLIPEIIRLNFGPRDHYPKLVHSGIADKVGKDFSELLRNLAISQVIIPDDDLEDHLRKRLQLPKASLEGQRIVKPPASEGSGTGDVAVAPQTDKAAIPAPAAKLAETTRMTLAEKNARTLQVMGDGEVALANVMRQNLEIISADLIKTIMGRVKKSTPAERQRAIAGLNATGVNLYKQAIKDVLSDTATKAIKAVKLETPGMRKVKFAEKVESSRFAEFDNLPKKIQDRIIAQSQLLADSQLADLEKAIFFQFEHSERTTDSDGLLEKDLADSADKYVGGQNVVVGAGNSTSLVVNETRNAFFFDEEVLQDVHSFTFVNNDPVSPICQDLAGSVFEADDPEAWRYSPPLHHLCKSIIVANIKGFDEPDITGLKPSKPSLDKYVTLAEGCRCTYN